MNYNLTKLPESSPSVEVETALEDLDLASSTTKYPDVAERLKQF